MIGTFIELQILKLDTQHQQETFYETHGKLLLLPWLDHFHFPTE